MKSLLSIVFVMAMAVNGLAVVHDVDIVDFSFNPPALTIDIGDTVRWENQDSAPHTSTSNTGVWDSGTLTTGQTFSFAFSEEGVFPYFCAIHPSMTATIVVIGPTSVDDDIKDLLPVNLALEQNYPNPFNASTTIKFSVSEATDIKLDIYDVTGRYIETLHEGSINSGEHTIVWDASDYTTGVYFYRLRTSGKSETRSMVYLR
ncbi:MAG: T9SS type A sorting domain-containing protein [candidate division Zixibacteria bacterium]|nr:T9SS type A sorting domain-containing protein [candidate division Zixibacteria bacterium]